jgi:transcription termination/antitermination protein NusG
MSSKEACMSKSWYVVHTYSGFEGRVKASIEERVNSLGLADKIARVLVPTENVVELREGKKKVVTKKFFPGYVLVEMELTDETWQLIKNTPKVTGFLGGGDKPAPLSVEEVETLLKQLDAGTATPREKAQFQKGDSVRIIDGPFLGFNGVVDEVNPDQGKMKVLVSIFGRATPVELSFLQAERL